MLLLEWQRGWWRLEIKQSESLVCDCLHSGTTATSSWLDLQSLAFGLTEWQSRVVRPPLLKRDWHEGTREIRATSSQRRGGKQAETHGEHVHFQATWWTASRAVRIASKAACRETLRLQRARSCQGVSTHHSAPPPRRSACSIQENVSHV
jgi:hypothetical protein